jgi:predicted Zn-ribbon and HTH transcriptional regulator
MWDRVQGDENTGHMGTSVTGGVRRVSEVLNRVDVLNGMDLKHGIKTFTLIVAECGECGRYDLNSGGEVLFKCPICKCDMDKVGTAVIVKPNDNDDF